jgi:hypothetical protein
MTPARHAGSARHAIALSQSPKRREASPDWCEDTRTGECMMFSALRNRGLLTIAALAMAALLGGCVA